LSRERVQNQDFGKRYGKKRGSRGGYYRKKKPAKEKATERMISFSFSEGKSRKRLHQEVCHGQKLYDGPNVTWRGKDFSAVKNIKERDGEKKS